MDWHRFKWTLERILRRNRADQDLEDEIRAHLSIQIQQRIEQGDTPEAARIHAARDFGNPVLVKEVTRQMWTFPSFERLWQDARYSVRSLRRSLGFTVLALAALALGIGATTSMFAVLYSVVIRPLPFPDPARLVAIWELRPKTGAQNVVSLVNFKSWRERARSFEFLAAYNQGAKNLLGGDEPVQVTGANVTADFFRVLGVQPSIGRGFAPGEDTPSSPPRAVLSYGFWQRRFGSDPSVIGRRISISGQHHEIVGIMPPGFAFPDRRVDVFTVQRSEYSGRDFLVVARLRPGITVERARSELVSLAAVTAVERPALNAGYSATATSLHEQTVGRIRPLLAVLFATVSLVLLIACANLANLFLMRAMGRQREISVRLALGAGRLQLAHQLTIESLILCGAGGLLGTCVAFSGLRALLATLPADFPLPRIHEIAIDSTVLIFAVALCVGIGLVFGLVPVFFSGRRDLFESLRNGGRSVAPRQRRFRQFMVVTETALALVLVIAAGLMIRSLSRFYSVQLGFQPQHVLTVRMSLLPGAPKSHAQFVTDILRRIRALPQVVSASSISILPMSGINSSTWFYRADLPEPDIAARPVGDISILMPEYFRTMGIPLLRGRDFAPSDRLGGPHVGIINQTAARLHFGDADPIGKHLAVSWNNAGTVEIIGVVADIRHRNPQLKPEPCLFLSNIQLPFPLTSLVVRTAADPHPLIAALKKEIHEVDEDQGVAAIETMEERVAAAGAQPRVQAWLVTVFSLIALALASIGIYGVISCTVRERTREIGVRVALGAGRLRIFGQMLRESLVPAGAGVTIGLLTSFALSRYLEGLLFEVRPGDPVVYAAVAALILIVAAAASVLPSRRAAAVDPVVALRDE